MESEYDTDGCHCPISSYMYIDIEPARMLTLPSVDEASISWRYATDDDQFMNIEDKPVKEDVKE